MASAWKRPADIPTHSFFEVTCAVIAFLAVLLGSIVISPLSSVGPRLTGNVQAPLVSAAACLRCETSLYRFNAGDDGANPQAPLLADSSGALYGTTPIGGASCNCGTVFELTPSSKGYVKKTIYAFAGGTDGSTPSAGVIEDAAGNLFGTAAAAGTATGSCSPEGCGVVFELTPTGSTYTLIVLHSFTGGADGRSPMGGLTPGPSGSLFGTTVDNVGSCGAVCGTAFALRPSGTGYTHTVIYRFTGKRDGENPRGTLIADSQGNLFGTTPAGGNSSLCTSCGTVFELSPSGSGYSERVIHRFKWGTDGKTPAPSLTFDAAGNLYGATQAGGNFKCDLAGCGTIFKLTPNLTGYHETVVYSFKAEGDGQNPQGVTFDASGTMFGTAQMGGGYVCTAGCGVIFKISPTSTGYKETVAYRFRGGAKDGALPLAPLVLGLGGLFYGTTSGAGKVACEVIGCGTVFSFKPR